MCEIIEWPKHLCDNAQGKVAVDSRTARHVRCAVCGSVLTDTLLPRPVAVMGHDIRGRAKVSLRLMGTCAKCAAESAIQVVQPGHDHIRTT